MTAYTYDDWADLLARFYFDDAHDGAEILFAVDEVSLAEASGLEEEAAARSLGGAVRLVIGDRWNVGAVKGLVDRWRKAGASGPHPALPFLALTVLAASRMGEYEGFAPHKFYVPLRRALVPEDPETDAPGSYRVLIRGLWDDLSRWANIDNGGRRGRLTIRDPGRHYGRKLAMQHALVKSYDLRQLDAFFRRIGLQPGEDVAPQELRRALSVWTADRSEPWARRLHRMSSDPDLEEHAEILLARVAERWDGRPRDPRTGRAVGRIRIGFGSRKRPELGVFVQWDERLPDVVEVALPSGSAIELRRDAGWYTPHPIGEVDVADAMANGLGLLGGRQSFDLRAEEVYALAYDDDLGAWTSVDSMSYGDRYHLVLERHALSEVLRFVESESSLTPQVEERTSRFLPTGWVLVSDVRIDARPNAAPPGCLASLVPAGSGPRLRLVGGLPLRAAHGVYLRGGEPSVALSTMTDAGWISITRVSTGEVEELRVPDGGNREVPLWHLQLEPDQYDIQHGDSIVALQIVEGIAEAAGQGAGSVTHRGMGSSEVVGTSVRPTPSGRHPITVPAPAADDSVILLGSRPGEQCRVQLPTWLSGPLGFAPSWTTIDAWPDFVPVWLLRRGADRRYEASVLTARNPDGDASGSGSQWARLISIAHVADDETGTAQDLWNRYRVAAGGQR
jgi:hypothetical protein